MYTYVSIYIIYTSTTEDLSLRRFKLKIYIYIYIYIIYINMYMYIYKYIYIYIYIYIYYDAKRESVKDYKCFFYQYSEFHVFTRQSSVENCY